jgi:hypothetical protein
MAGTFVARIDELQEKVGRGDLTLRVNVHQAYAAAEHVRMYYRHPRGGMANYLEMPFESEHGDMLRILADGVLEDLNAAAIDAVGKFEEWVREFAPVMSETLRDSCNLYVEDNGGQIYEKPQEAPFNEKKAL